MKCLQEVHQIYNLGAVGIKENLDFEVKRSKITVAARPHITWSNKHFERHFHACLRNA